MGQIDSNVCLQHSSSPILLPRKIYSPQLINYLIVTHSMSSYTLKKTVSLEQEEKEEQEEDEELLRMALPQGGHTYTHTN